MIDDEFSVVKYYSVTSGLRCGYCRSPNSYTSIGMWAYTMSVKEYQHLIDRGWRRSGRYVYKPSMSQTCCPTYTIRCEVGDLEISKSQKKVLKKFYNHLRFGDSSRDSQTAVVGNTPSEGNTSADALSSCTEDVSSEPRVAHLENIKMDASPCKEGQISIPLGLGSSDGAQKPEDPAQEQPSAEESVDLNMPGTSNEVAPEATPRLRKAKQVRLENKYRKLRSCGMTDEEAVKLTYETKKTSPKKRVLSFEEYFPQPEDMSYYIHKFKIELIPVSLIKSDHMMLQETQKLYAKYQMAVHNDSPSNCSMAEFKRFLVDSPLFDSCPSQRPPSGYGSFHQQYWLNGNLIAVGVIDILPKCISSVYFFYDPELRSLTLGTYGSLQEIYYTRGLKFICSTIEFYYLGYYIHHCPRMNYKGKYHPSYLLCPETYTWHKLEKCLPMLEKNKYCRFEKDPTVIDINGNVNLAKVMILYKNRAMSYLKYKRINPEAGDEEEVEEYAKLVGKDGYESILLYRR